MIRSHIITLSVLLIVTMLALTMAQIQPQPMAFNTAFNAPQPPTTQPAQPAQPPTANFLGTLPNNGINTNNLGGVPPAANPIQPPRTLTPPQLLPQYKWISSIWSNGLQTELNFNQQQQSLHLRPSTKAPHGNGMGGSYQVDVLTTSQGQQQWVLKTSGLMSTMMFVEQTSEIERFLGKFFDSKNTILLAFNFSPFDQDTAFLTLETTAMDEQNQPTVMILSFVGTKTLEQKFGTPEVVFYEVKKGSFVDNVGLESLVMRKVTFDENGVKKRDPNATWDAFPISIFTGFDGNVVEPTANRVIRFRKYTQQPNVVGGGTTIIFEHDMTVQWGGEF